MQASRRVAEYWTLICFSLTSHFLCLFVCSANEDVQSLMRSSSATLNRSSHRYVDSLQCMLYSIAALPLESLLPIIASVVLHLFVPLLYLGFDESRTALGWFAVGFLLAHTLYHCTPISIGEAVSVARMCTLLPMTFELWMSAGEVAVAGRHRLSAIATCSATESTDGRCSLRTDVASLLCLFLLRFRHRQLVRVASRLAAHSARDAREHATVRHRQRTSRAEAADEAAWL